MAKPPLPIEKLTELYGPHLDYEPPGGWQDESRNPAQKLVKTHCCFCGQQCGIQLKVRDNQVIGFEPWEDFPFNKGMLCPKGVKRYMQSNHSDRLLNPLMRSDEGFKTSNWEDALDFIARRIKEIQEKYGKDSVAVYGGASLTTEKSYLLGKFARVAVGTRHIDYNGRLCMVSAGTAYKLAFGVDRSPNPWEDIPKADVIMIAGSNTAECSPITTDYIWRMKDNGGRLIVVDPRMTPISRNNDLYLPVRPGTDVILYMSILHVILRDNLQKSDFIEAHTTGFDDVAESVKQYTPEFAADITGVPPQAIEKAAHWLGEAKAAMIMHARGVEHQSKGVENCSALINICLATGNIGREGAGCVMITGQGNGQGGREHGQKCDQLPGQRSIDDEEGRKHVASVWKVEPDAIPRAGYSAMEIMGALHSGEIKALVSICFNPMVSLPHVQFT
ncbi:MAG: molybdopterin-dependent oxidoreductase, partial [Candidatus Melainabacteria bacterium]|nr:molybdopterin-dependent oxidoreductase [Candidatus Melainabacteria bacterium]